MRFEDEKDYIMRIIKEMVRVLFSLMFGKKYVSVELEDENKYEVSGKNNCYKIMLLTGAKEQKTLDFYKRAGYNCTDKTAFIQWLD